MKKWSFGVDNDRLIKLVLAGKKMSTSCLYENNELPVIGEESIIQFDNEKDACIVKTVDYKIMKFNEMTEELAQLEGEGDLSLDYWKKVHFEFFKSIKPEFSEEDKIIFEIFQITKNLVEERLELAKKIANQNFEIFGQINSIEEVNAGYRNTIFNINNENIIKICTNKALEKSFKTEYNFYISNKGNQFIPNFYKYDDSKKYCDYVYEIIERFEGKTLYYYWYKMSEIEREETIKNLITIVKQFHSVKTESFDWENKIECDIRKWIEKCKDLFDSEDYAIIMKSIEKYKEYFVDNRFALLHNDLHFDNIIYNNGDLKIIDFNDSMNAPIDFEFRILYMCQYRPWKWANIEIDSNQKPEDYKNIWNYIKKYYKELAEIKYLEQRMVIYSIWDDSKHLKEYREKELITNIVENSKKLL